jgi:LmbE family N-acetylglucosaminyl deacetylase
MPGTVLAIVPHSDDAEFYAGGTIARFTREGSRVLIVITTDGRRGSFEHPSETLAPIRAEEARQSSIILGAEPPILLAHPDMELDKLPPGRLREQFVRLIRQHRPEVLIAQDPFLPYEFNPDHRTVAWAVSDAVHYAHLPHFHPEHLAMGLEPHFVTEKYFFGDFPPEIVLQIRPSMKGLEDRGFCHVGVNITNTIDIKMAALAEHKTQMAFRLEEILRQARHLGPAGPDLQRTMSEVAGDPLTAMTWFIRAQATKIGWRIGASFGEAFRYERFHPAIESFLTGQS